MKTLYLLRHAKSSWDDPGLADHDRPLAPRGRRAAQRMARHVKGAGVRPDLVLCSSAVRARQTLEAVAPALGKHIETLVDEHLYGASGGELLARLHRVTDEARAVLVVGHNPGLEDLAKGLVGDGDPEAMRRLEEKFPTGALATMTLDGPWSALAAGQAFLASLVLPRQLDG